MNAIRDSLPRYSTILSGTGTAAYLKAKQTAVSYDDHDPDTRLWELLARPHDDSSSASTTLLDLERMITNRLLPSCCLCERRCGKDRRNGSGACKVQDTRIPCEFLHTGEEEVLVPSHTVFFSGCTMHCCFCQNADISQHQCGESIPPAAMAAIISRRKAQGAKNVNWVGGDPTPNLPYILEVLACCEENIAQVWNSNMYCSRETMQLLANVIDLYLTDFKFGNDRCAATYAGVQRYTDVMARNHLSAAASGDVIVRHLVMPSHVECCSRPILHWLADHIPTAPVNIMAQYRPEYRAELFPEINRTVTREEFRIVVDTARSLGLTLL